MQNKGKKFLSELKLHSDYLKWRDEDNRYETWEEACESILDGHRTKYADKLDQLEPYLESVYDSMTSKSVLASQRNLQFRYPQVNKSNARIYNCSSTHCVRNRVFQEVFYLGLNGCGVGASLLLPFVNKLSKIEKRKLGTKTHIVEDSIEGWADALGVLLSSYFVDKQPFPEYAGYEVKFDYSLIRPQGTKISGGFKAPGPDGLKFALEKIESLLEHWIDNEGNTIRPILAFDIFCHSADSVLSGSVRRSALNMLVDPNDQEMIHAKMGNWRAENPQRARSNNSVILRRKDVKKEEFQKIISLNEGDSDIGFAFVNSYMDLYNPCHPGYNKILTNEGYKRLDELVDKENIVFINPLGHKVSGRVVISGYKPLVDMKLSTGKILSCTEDHVFLTADGDEVQAKDLRTKRLSVYYNKNPEFDAEYVKYGFLQGDGSLSKLDDKSENHLMYVNVGEKDGEILSLFNLTKKDGFTYSISGYVKPLQELGFSSKVLPERTLPETIDAWDDLQLKSFLRGLYSANGSVITNSRVALKMTCKEVAIQLKEILKSRLDIDAYYTTNKPTNVKFKNGDYLCKESYDLNICRIESVIKFAENINFIHEYKRDSLDKLIKERSPFVYSVKSRKNLELVYDFEIDDMIHYGVVEGFASHNCFEISKLPILTEEDMSLIGYDELPEFVDRNINNFGIAFCNLTEINAEKCVTKEKFLKSCTDASVLGTLQAGYTTFPYLGEVTEKIVRREALLGVSITGWFNNPKLFNVDWLKEGANLVKTVNKEIAKIIEINPAARTTTVKPSGTASVILGTASGIHPDHSERYFRIMQLNKHTDTAKWLKENMEFLLEESVWSATNNDYVVFVPVENPKDGLFKKSVKGIDHLKYIELVQTNWVKEGTNDDLCLYKGISHNVSNTVLIEDMDKMIDYIFERKEIFNAVSFLPDFGDKVYNQAPFTSVLSLEELIEEYGKASVFASGLIVDGLHYFDNNLWLACDLLLDLEERNPIIGTREQVMLRKYWLKRAKKFAKNYFKGDLHKTVFCLKDVHLFHKWDIINRQFKEVDFSKILSKPEFKDIGDYGAVACSGGQCEISRI